MITYPPVIERLLSKVEIDINGCWLWTGTMRNRRGYGCISVQGKDVFTHRLSYEFFKGTIPQGLTIDHLCRNHSCINPDHLEATTNKTNVLRGIGLTAAKAHQICCKNRHPFDLFNTRWDKRGRRECRACKKLLNQNRYKKEEPSSTGATI